MHRITWIIIIILIVSVLYEIFANGYSMTPTDLLILMLINLIAIQKDSHSKCDVKKHE
jgi:hypothetical protein